jgi:hypothetical protein
MGIIKSFIGANLIYIIVAAVIAAMVGAAYFYYKDTQKRLIQAAVERVHMERDLEALKAQQAARDRDMAVVQEQQQILLDGLTAIREEALELEKLFRDHDLAALAAAKPRLIERRVNDATKKLFKDLEALSRGK